MRLRHHADALAVAVGVRELPVGEHGPLPAAAVAAHARQGRRVLLHFFKGVTQEAQVLFDQQLLLLGRPWPRWLHGQLRGRR